MDLPILVFGVLLALILGAVYHLWRGGRAGRLLLFLAVSILGFSAGQYLGVKFDLAWFKLGGLYLAPAAAGSLLLLVISDWLSLIEPEKKKRK